MEEMFKFLKDSFEGNDEYEVILTDDGNIMVSHKNHKMSAVIIFGDDEELVAADVKLANLREVTIENIMDFLNGR